jgi:hypothetical protein
MTNTDDSQPVASIGPALIRTAVPLLVALLVQWAARRDLVIDSATQSAIISILSTLSGAVYYAVVRFLERRWPKAGWLLGSPHVPYYPSKVPVPSSEDDFLDADSADV